MQCVGRLNTRTSLAFRKTISKFVFTDNRKLISFSQNIGNKSAFKSSGSRQKEPSWQTPKGKRKEGEDLRCIFFLIIRFSDIFVVYLPISKTISSLNI